MTDSNPYQAYTEGSVLNTNPVRLVVLLYEGARDATQRAALCLEQRDIWGRGKAINKAIAILSELLLSLNDEKGGEISRNLRGLYLYMQKRLIEAHARQIAGPLTEVTKLLDTLLEGWRYAAGKQGAEQQSEPRPGRHRQHSTEQAGATKRRHESHPYASYLHEEAEELAGTIFSF